MIRRYIYKIIIWAFKLCHDRMHDQRHSTFYKHIYHKIISNLFQLITKDRTKTRSERI